MRCPKCRFVSSDKKDICPSCRIDLRPYKHFLGLPITNPKSSLTDLLRQLNEVPKESPRPSLAKTEVLVKPSPAPEKTSASLDDEVDLLAHTEVAKPTSAPPRQSVSLIDRLKSSSALNNIYVRKTAPPSASAPVIAPLVDDALPLHVSGDFSASTEFEERETVHTPDDDEGLPLFHTRETKSALETERANNLEPDPDNQRGTPYAPRINSTPLVQPEVVEFNEDDEELLRELDAMIGDTEVNVSSVKIERPKPKEEPSNVFIDDDLEISFEFEMEGQALPEEDSSESTAEDFQAQEDEVQESLLDDDELLAEFTPLYDDSSKQQPSAESEPTEEPAEEPLEEPLEKPLEKKAELEDKSVEEDTEISNAFETVLNGFAAQIHDSTSEVYKATESGAQVVSSTPTVEIDHLPAVEDYVLPIDTEADADERPLVVDLESAESTPIAHLDSLQDQLSPVMDGIEKSLSLLVQREFPIGDTAATDKEEEEENEQADFVEVIVEELETSTESTTDLPEELTEPFEDLSSLESEIVEEFDDFDQSNSSSIIESLSSLIPMRAKAAPPWNDAIAELQVWTRYQQTDLTCLEFKISDLAPVSRSDRTDVLFSVAASEIAEPLKAKAKSSSVLPNSESRRVESLELKQAVMEVAKEIVAEEQASRLPQIGISSKTKDTSESGSIEIEFYSPDRNQRLQAYITDIGAAFLLTFMIAAFSYLPSQVITSLLAGELPALNLLLPVLSRLIGCFLFITVIGSATLMAGRGMTIGQKLTRLEVVDHNGMVPSFGTALLWSILQILHPLTLGLTALDTIRPSGITATERLAAVRVVKNPE